MTEKYSEKREDYGKSRRKIDETDIEIMKILQKDGRISMSDISKKVGKGISTVHARMRSLEEDSCIRHYTAVLNPSVVGKGTLAFILITVRYRVPGKDETLSQRQFCQEIAEHPFVQDVHVMSGEYDVILKVRTKDIEELNGFIVDFLRQIPAVDKTLTMFAMDSYLETSELRGLTTH
jgi:DNA-binding Lrp family transcriptional regulator